MELLPEIERAPTLMKQAFTAGDADKQLSTGLKMNVARFVKSACAE
jgi:hypothetical protein